MGRILLFFLLLSFSCPVLAQDSLPSDPEFDEILAQDLNDLTVTSVSKRSQRLNDTAAAVYVLTQEELRRAGVYSIPEALRLVPGMNVAKLSNDRWAVSARGFNGALNNKLLVLIDGRAIYTPLFSGVYWGDQSTTINDIERIEVIRGPGASLYGANAVNGVVNIITKSAENTQGNMVSATATAKGNGTYEARHGGKIGDEDAYYRVYGQYYDAASWHRGRGGFRADGTTVAGDNYTLQGDVYHGDQNAMLRLPTLAAPFSQNFSSTDEAYGGNILGRWSHKISNDSELSLQAYIDHYARSEYNATQRVSTADMQLQHSIALNDRNQFIWGGGARLHYQNLDGTYAANVTEQYDTYEILNTFVQDEYALIPGKAYLTAGTKLEYNDFTGFVVQPSLRLLGHVTDSQTMWAAISRAVRTPSSIEEDVSLLAQVTAGPTEYRVFGNKHQKPEELIAYELGHRFQATDDLFFDSTVFFNDYDQLQTIGAAGTPFTGINGNTVIPFGINNLGSGYTYGAEFASTWNIHPDWRLTGSYSYLKMNLETKPGVAVTLDSAERLSPQHQFSVQSYYNITDDVHWDNVVYYVSELSPPVKDYVRYDTRIAWLVYPGMELSLIGRNLVDPHIEFPANPQPEIDSSLIGQLLWKF